MRVAIIEYNAGNVQSVTYALNRLGVEPEITADPEAIRRADRVIFPGVGEASTAMSHLRKTGLHTLIPTLKQPVLGICLGLHMMCRHSEENDTQGLGIFDLEVRRFPPEEKVPHMGWNTIHALKGPLFEGIEAGEYLYFVHSYYAELCPDTVATCDYIRPFTVALQHQNFFAVQPHPEKSSHTGAKIIQNFLNLDGA